MALTTRATHVLQWRIQREATSEQADLIKCVVVRIESATRLMKSESLVIVDKNATVNTFPGLAHRPSHHGSGLQRSR